MSSHLGIIRRRVPVRAPFHYRCSPRPLFFHALSFSIFWCHDSIALDLATYPLSTGAEAGEGCRSAEEQGRIPEAEETGNPEEGTGSQAEEEPGTAAVAGPGER